MTLEASNAHSRPAGEVLAALASSPEGLGPGEAAARLARFGRNALPPPRRPGWPMILLRQFLNPLIYVLLAAAVVSALLHDVSDAAFIFVVLGLNAVIGTVQEFGAERSAEALRRLVAAKAYVVRAGVEREVEAEEIVPGDVVVLEAGAKVPADVRLFAGAALETDESALTGESYAVEKSGAGVLPARTGLADRTNVAFAGTLVTRGRARGVVIATGATTEIGRIAASIAHAEGAPAPLLVRMDHFTKRLALGVAAAVAVLAAVLIARGAAVGEVFFFAVALAVAAIPEGLPVALTVALAIGARRMSGRKVIARRLAAVEALGSCTFIASDKTGTLTMNELTVRKLLLPGEPPWDVTGEGVVPAGDILVPSLVDPALARPAIERLAAAFALSSDGVLARRDGEWVSHGDPVDVALLALAHKAGLSPDEVAVKQPRLTEIPFEPELRFAASLNVEPRPDGTPRSSVAFVKGAGERILPMCTRMATLAGDVRLDAERLAAAADALARGGYRMLAVASGSVEVAGGELAPEDLRDLVFMGFVGMIDPLRPETKESVLACHRAGIRVAMVTGDHPVTALAIARELGFADRDDEVVTGPALHAVAARGEDAVDDLVRRARVFARVEPNQKLEIVRSLIRLGHFVAVTGDGANDAPALRAAHIGVAMGKRGTDVARETADLILTDDNFASIVTGVEEGRIAYANMRKVIFLLVSTGAAEILLFLLCTAAGLPLPLLPAQLLWLNLVTNGIQDVALAFEPGEGGELSRAPRSPTEPIFDRPMIERTLVSAVVMAAVGVYAFDWMLRHGWELASARNGLLLLMVLFENVQAGNSRSESRSLLLLSPLRNPLLLGGTVAAQLVHIGAMHLPGLRGLLRVEPVPLGDWAIFVALALSLFVAVELHGLLRRARAARAESTRRP